MGGRKPFAIGIAGPSGSGKTTLALALCDRLGLPHSSVIPLDAYYRDLSHLRPEERERHNFDEPKALDFELLLAHLRALSRGKPIERPVYLFEAHERGGRTERIEPGDCLVVEGLFALYWQAVRDLLNLKIFLEVGDGVGFARRETRDVRERRRSKEFVTRQYLETVRPMCEKYVLPTRRHADIVVSGESLLAEAVQRIINRIQQVSGPFTRRHSDPAKGT